MIKRAELIAYCDNYLSSHLFKDYCPNGLQVEGKETINIIVSGVTASQALIDAAIEQKADLLLVHHGFFWKGENPVITGIKKSVYRLCCKIILIYWLIICLWMLIKLWVIMFCWQKN